MPLEFNIRHLDKADLHLTGDLPAQDLDVENVDDMVRLDSPLRYDLQAERLSDSILVQGRLQCTLACECVRCLRPFSQELELDQWTCDLPLEGEDRVTVNNDSIDLTPYLREDILLGFPQHPLCGPGCPGVPNAAQHLSEAGNVQERACETSSAWAELNKLKF